MPTPDPQVLEQLRQAILQDAPPPTVDPADVAQLASETMTVLSTGRLDARATAFRVRLAGSGVTGHSIPVHTASQLLDAIQGTVTAFGSAVKRQKKASAPKNSDGHRLGVRKATELQLSAGIAPGSVVFQLQGLKAPSPNKGQALVSSGTDTLVDVAIREMLRLINEADADQADAIGDLTKHISALGAMVASKLNRLAEQASLSEIEVDLGHWAPSGARHSAVLRERGANAILDAVDRNRSRLVKRTVTGVLRTVSDGADLCRMTLDDGSTMRLSVDPMTGPGLGSFLSQRVVAEVETTVKWKIASGRETQSHSLVSVDLADDEVPL